MGLAVFDCEICGQAPYLKIGRDTRETCIINGKYYNICPYCYKLLFNPSRRTNKENGSLKQIEISGNFLEIFILKRRQKIKKLMEETFKADNAANLSLVEN